MGGDIHQALEIDIHQAVMLGVQVETLHHKGVRKVEQQGGLTGAALADHGGALMHAGEQAAGDLAQLVLAAVEEVRVADGVAEGEGVIAHWGSNIHILKLSSFNCRGVCGT